MVYILITFYSALHREPNLRPHINRWIWFYVNIYCLFYSYITNKIKTFNQYFNTLIPQFTFLFLNNSSIMHFKVFSIVINLLYVFLRLYISIFSYIDMPFYICNCVLKFVTNKSPVKHIKRFQLSNSKIPLKNKKNEFIGILFLKLLFLF